MTIFKSCDFTILQLDTVLDFGEKLNHTLCLLECKRNGTPD